MTNTRNYIEQAIRTAPTLERNNTSLTLGAIGIAGESIEVFEAVTNTLYNRDKIVKELGDVTWYMALLCFVADIPFDRLTIAHDDAVSSAFSITDTNLALNHLTGTLLIAAKNVSEFVKKQVFHNHPADNVALQMLLGALMRTIQRVGARVNANIDEILEQNIEKLKERYPERFTPEGSLNRREYAQGQN